MKTWLRQYWCLLWTGHNFGHENLYGFGPEADAYHTKITCRRCFKVLEESWVRTEKKGPTT